jgi:hypothetical protein
MSSKPEDHGVPITIDKQHYRSPEHTTGKALYLLGQVQAGYDLWLEVKGPGDDQIIQNDDKPVHVQPGSHYYTAQSTLNPGTDR